MNILPEVFQTMPLGTVTKFQASGIGASISWSNRQRLVSGLVSSDKMNE